MVRSNVVALTLTFTLAMVRSNEVANTLSTHADPWTDILLCYTLAEARRWAEVNHAPLVLHMNEKLPIYGVHPQHTKRYFRCVDCR